MRLERLNSGHRFKTKAMFAMIRVMSRLPVPDVVKLLTYRPEYFGRKMNALFQHVMRGPSQWTVGERELFAAYVSKVNQCEF
jgi:hypothetical protein